jgi:hypothetical protein
MIIAVVTYGDVEYVTQIKTVADFKSLQSVRIQLSSPCVTTVPETIWKQLSTQQFTPEPWPVGIKPRVELFCQDNTGRIHSLQKVFDRPYHLPLPKSEDIKIKW